MSPTSLANRLTSRERSRSIRPIPPHRRFAASVARLPPRARAVLAIALLLLVWRLARAPSPLLSTPKVPQRSSTGAQLSAKRVQFAPSRVRESSARVRYKDGAVQEVFARSSKRTEKGREQTYDVLWAPGEVQEVELPVGGRLIYVNRDGDQTELEYTGRSVCRGRSCADMRSVLLEQDVLSGLRHLRQSDPSKPLTLSLPSSYPFSSDSVTLVTQFTLSRISRFERMLHAWDGPLSAAIYLTEAADITQLEEYLSSPDRSARWDQVALTIVKPDYSISEEALLARLRYPINRLRNLALSLTPTPYVLVVDVDFVPSPNMHFLLSSRGVPLLNCPSSRNSLSPTLHRTAVVIPTFALVPSFNGSFPSTPAELASLVTSTPPLATLTDPNAGHGPTLPSLLFPPPSPLSSLSPSPDPSHSYEICYEPQWEPYYLVARSSHPLYDDRFTDQGGDKQAHALVLNALGFSFHVLRDVWVVHPPKTDKREEAWPAAKLVPERGRAERSAAQDGGGEDEEGEHHFNLAAQRDESRYRYFQDFLPEMERDWGLNVRWPRGCSARIAAGRRSFGRARAATSFGL
ncbi:hypothetical protein JCM5296_001339 [Sporobolomyces johnsonii]